MSDLNLNIVSKDIVIDLVGVNDEIVFDFAGAMATSGGVSSLLTKDDDYTILAANLGLGKSIGMTEDVEARTFTLPEIVSGMVDPINILKLGSGYLSITPFAGQYLAYSDVGVGLRNSTDQKYVGMTLLPVFSTLTWVLLGITGTWRKL